MNNNIYESYTTSRIDALIGDELRTVDAITRRTVLYGDEIGNYLDQYEFTEPAFDVMCDAAIDIWSTYQSGTISSVTIYVDGVKISAIGITSGDIADTLYKQLISLPSMIVEITGEYAWMDTDELKRHISTISVTSVEPGYESARLLMAKGRRLTPQELFGYFFAQEGVDAYLWMQPGYDETNSEASDGLIFEAVIDAAQN